MTVAPSARRTLLITGATGKIGTALRAELAGEFELRSLVRAPVAGVSNIHVGDVADIDSLAPALRGVDAVIHLAGNSAIDQTWEAVHAVGIGGAYAVLEAARRAGVGKVIMASSSYVSGWREIQRGEQAGPASPVCPTTLYGVGKLAAELLGQYFAARFGMSVACLRIGAFYAVPPRPDPDEPDRHDILRTWCSPRDLAQLVRRCVHAEGLGFAVFYAVSNNTRRVWDITNARTLLGYEPEDDAETLLDPSAYAGVVKRALQARQRT